MPKVKLDRGHRTLFEEELARIVRRANRLRAAMDGSADIMKVRVKEAKVPEHTRSSHTRYIIVRRKKT